MHGIRPQSSLRALLQAHARLDRRNYATGVVALAIFARRAAENFVHRQFSTLPRYPTAPDRARPGHPASHAPADRKTSVTYPARGVRYTADPARSAGPRTGRACRESRLRRCPVIPASVSIVTTMFDWLNSGFGPGGVYARTRVIFILGSAACNNGRCVRLAVDAAASDLRNVLRFIVISADKYIPEQVRQSKS